MYSTVVFCFEFSGCAPIRRAHPPTPPVRSPTWGFVGMKSGPLLNVGLEWTRNQCPEFHPLHTSSSRITKVRYLCIQFAFLIPHFTDAPFRLKPAMPAFEGRTSDPVGLDGPQPRDPLTSADTKWAHLVILFSALRHFPISQLPHIKLFPPFSAAE